MFEMEGFDEFGKKLKKMQKAAEEMEGTHEVPMDELLSDSFVQKNTKYQSADEMFEKSGFKIDSPEEFAAIPDAEWDVFIRGNTKFPNWEEMLGEASADYSSRKMGF